jgi:hypothetical protein
VIDFLDVPACSWLWLLVAMGAYIWLLFDSIVFDPVAWQKLSTARADLAAKLAAEAKAKEEADKAAAAAAAAAAAGCAAAAPAVAEAEAKKAEAEKAEAAAAAEKKEFVLPPVPPPRVTLPRRCRSRTRPTAARHSCWRRSTILSALLRARWRAPVCDQRCTCA